LNRARVLAVGTANPDKLRELRKLLGGLGVRVLPVAAFGRPPRVAENGRTFEENASKKARVYSRFTGGLVLADDSGLCVPSLRNRPGVYSARFAGPGCTYADNNAKLLRLLEGRPARARRAFFISTVALYRAGKKVGVFRGTVWGRIAPRPAGSNGFGYDPVFVARGHRDTFAEMSPDQKNRLSHRGRALARAKRFLRAYFRLPGRRAS
jgi:XTP/dITP diphosphohydrolase